MQKTYEIVLGERTFTIDAPLTFKQLRVVEPAISKIVKLRTEQGVVAAAYDEMAAIILACISRKNPEFTGEQLNELPCKPTELIKAFETIGLASGLMKEKPEGQPVGEAKAETANP